MRQRSMWVAIAMINSIAGIHGMASAQTMYRCGNSYQDRPCEVQEGKVIGAAAVAAPSASKLPVDADCVQRGVKAQRVSWAREAGQTSEAQLQAATTAETKRLITDVYRKKGSSVEVRAAIEADCLADKENATKTAILLEQAGKLRGQPATEISDSAGSARTVKEPKQNAALNQKLAQIEAREASYKKALCIDLKTGLDDVRNQQRTGGSAGTMEALNRQHSDIGRKLREAGC
jgi:hypothetical protein